MKKVVLSVVLGLFVCGILGCSEPPKPAPKPPAAGEQKAEEKK